MQIGPYHIQEKLGEGRMAIVYRAVENPGTAQEHTYALKVLRHDMAAEDAKELEREAEILKRLDSEFIVRVFGYRQYAERLNTSHCIVMEYVSGTDLYKVIRARQRLAIGEVIRYAWQMCQALDHAHAKKIIHRDIKPQNIIVQDSGVLKVCDFGIAQIVSTSMASLTNVEGTPAYISPEQARRERADERSDIYSLGVVMYHMLTGNVPFTGIDPTVVLNAHLTDEPERVEQKRRDTPQELARIVHKALEKNPKARFQTAREMAERLESLAVQRGVSLPDVVHPSFLAALKSIFLDWDVRRLRDTVTNLGASTIQWLIGLVLVALLALVGLGSLVGGGNGASPTSQAPSALPGSIVALALTDTPTPTATDPPPTDTPTTTPTRTPTITLTPSDTPTPSNTPEPPTPTPPPPSPTPRPTPAPVGTQLGDGTAFLAIEDYRYTAEADPEDGAVWFKPRIGSLSTSDTIEVQIDYKSITAVDNEGTRYNEYWKEYGEYVTTGGFGCKGPLGQNEGLNYPETLSFRPGDSWAFDDYTDKVFYLTKDRTYNHRVAGGCDIRFRTNFNTEYVDVTIPQVRYRVGSGPVVTLRNLTWRLVRP